MAAAEAVQFGAVRFEAVQFAAVAGIGEVSRIGVVPGIAEVSRIGEVPWLQVLPPLPALIMAVATVIQTINIAVEAATMVEGATMVEERIVEVLW